MKRLLSVMLMLVMMGFAGCTASFFLVGATMHDSGAPSGAAAVWTAPSCESLTGGQPIAGPAGVSYYLELGSQGPALYELDEAGNGARIVNHWEDAEGDHFFTYVKTSGAWHYVIPKDLSQPAVRFAYEATANWNTEQVEGVGVVKPTGTPSWKCPLVKQ